MTCSMSRKGNCWDNASTESWFNGFKNQRTCGNQYAIGAVHTAEAFDYIKVLCNRRRRRSSLGYQSPVQYLEHWLLTHGRRSQVA
jgi:transposase InsO family protein